MNLKRLTLFRDENITGKKPVLETMKGWPGVCKLCGEWWIDIDVISLKFQETEAANDLLDVLMDDKDVAEIVGFS